MFSGALFDLERYAFIWKVKLVHSTAEHPPEMNVEYVSKRYYIILGIFCKKKNGVNLRTDRNITFSSRSKYAIKETWPFYQNVAIL